ncbi:hypothetical protein HAX54_013015 [Datura stramonium]|uniref:Uncharacterized protein n=1 Tax=Datura stramonium TaxID=4076 RepID=A0ABS8Y1H0_DATST|nr:hypothetical protein [Datura stramonium]
MAKHFDLVDARKGPRKDDAPSSTKENQPQLNGQGKISHSSKSNVTPSNPLQTTKVASDLKFRRAAITTAFEAIDVAHKRKKPSNSSSKSAEKLPGIVLFYSGTSKPPISLNGDGITSAASSSNEIKRLKKKPKDLSDQHFKFGLGFH